MTEKTENATSAEMIEALKQRAATYALLSRLYAKEVDATLLDE